MVASASGDSGKGPTEVVSRPGCSCDRTGDGDGDDTRLIVDRSGKRLRVGVAGRRLIKLPTPDAGIRARGRGKRGDDVVARLRPDLEEATEEPAGDGGGEAALAE